MAQYDDVATARCRLWASKGRGPIQGVGANHSRTAGSGQKAVGSGQPAASAYGESRRVGADRMLAPDTWHLTPKSYPLPLGGFDVLNSPARDDGRELGREAREREYAARFCDPRGKGQLRGGEFASPILLPGAQNGFDGVGRRPKGWTIPVSSHGGSSPTCFSGSETGCRPIKMLKMEIDPGMCMKTKGRLTKCPAKNTTLHKKMHQLHHNQQESSELIGRNAQIAR